MGAAARFAQCRAAAASGRQHPRPAPFCSWELRPLRWQRQGDKRLPSEKSFPLDGGADVPLQPLLARSEGSGRKLQVIGAELFGQCAADSIDACLRIGM